MSSQRKLQHNARLDDWLETAEAILADQRSQSISPSLYGSQHGERHDSTLTLHEFEEALPAALKLLSSDPGRWILIIEDTASFNRYVQLIAFEDGSLMAEAVSNINLRPEEQWDAEHEDLLARIGWSPPEAGVEDGDPNWWVWFPSVDAADGRGSEDAALHPADGLRASGARPVDGEDVQLPEERPDASERGSRVSCCRGDMKSRHGADLTR